MTYFQFQTDPLPSVYQHLVDPAHLQAALDRPYRAAGLTPPVLMDPTVDDAIAAMRDELQSATTLVTDDLTPAKAKAAVAKVVEARAKLRELDAIAAERQTNAGLIACAAFEPLRAKAFAEDLVPACEDVVEAVRDAVDVLEDVADPLDAAQVLQAGKPAAAWSDLVGALTRMNDLASLEGHGLNRWVWLPDHNESMLADSFGYTLLDEQQPELTRVLKRFERALEFEQLKKRDLDHVILDLAAGRFAPLELRYSGDEAELQRRSAMTAYALTKTKLTFNEYAERTGKPLAKRDHPFSADPRSPRDIAWQRGEDV